MDKHTSEQRLSFLRGISSAQSLKPHLQQGKKEPCFNSANRLPSSEHTGTEDFRTHDFTVSSYYKNQNCCKNSPIGQSMGGGDIQHVEQFVPDRALSCSQTCEKRISLFNKKK